MYAAVAPPMAPARVDRRKHCGACVRAHAATHSSEPKPKLDWEWGHFGPPSPAASTALRRHNSSMDWGWRFDCEVFGDTSSLRTASTYSTVRPRIHAKRAILPCCRIISATRIKLGHRCWSARATHGSRTSRHTLHPTLMSRTDAPSRWRKRATGVEHHGPGKVARFQTRKRSTKAL